MKEQNDQRGRVYMSVAESVMDRVVRRARAAGILDTGNICSLVSTFLIALTNGKLAVDDELAIPEVIPTPVLVPTPLATTTITVANQPVPSVVAPVQPVVAPVQSGPTTPALPIPSDFVPQEPAPALSRGRGRPPGSKNLPKSGATDAPLPATHPATVAPATVTPVAAAPSPQQPVTPPQSATSQVATPPAPTNGNCRPPATHEIRVNHPQTGLPTKVITGGVESGTLTAIIALCRELESLTHKGAAKDARELFVENNGLLPTKTTACFTEQEACDFVLYLKESISSVKGSPAESVTEF